jgi:hypothetical protein
MCPLRTLSSKNDKVPLSWTEMFDSLWHSKS